MTPAFQKLFLALFVYIVIQLSLSVQIEAAHGDSYARSSFAHKKRVPRSDGNVPRGVDRIVARDDGLFGSVLGKYTSFLHNPSTMLAPGHLLRHIVCEVDSCGVFVAAKVTIKLKSPYSAIRGYFSLAFPTSYSCGRGCFSHALLLATYLYKRPALRVVKASLSLAVLSL